MIQGHPVKEKLKPNEQPQKVLKKKKSNMRNNKGISRNQFKRLEEKLIKSIAEL